MLLMPLTLTRYISTDVFDSTLTYLNYCALMIARTILFSAACIYIPFTNCKPKPSYVFHKVVR